MHRHQRLDPQPCATLGPDDARLAARFDEACAPLTDDEVADIVGEAAAVVRAYREGAAQLSVTALMRLCKAKGLSAAHLLADLGDPPA
jgi:hypothetical protein